MNTPGTSPESASRPLDQLTQAQHAEAEAALENLLSDENYDALQERFPPDPEGKANADPGYGSFVKDPRDNGTLLEEYFVNDAEVGQLNVTHQINESKAASALPGQTYERRYLIAEQPDGTRADLAVQDGKVIVARVREADRSELADSPAAIARAEEIAKQVLAKLLDKPVSAAQG